MRVNTPEISWHGRDPIYSCAVQPTQEGKSPLRLATSGTDANIRMWYIRTNSDNRSQPEFASNLSRHNKAVNCVRWSPDGAILASGADDSCVMLWRLSDSQSSGLSFGKEDEEVNKETWNAFKTLRGHLEDVYDMCWSTDGSRLISGSVDNSAIIWDINKGEKLHLLKDHHSFVQGVAWDPQNVMCATMSCDRSLRIYNLKTQKCQYNIQKMPTTIINNNGESQTKQIRMFHDDTMKSFFRRIAFTPDGEILLAPAGSLEMPGDSAPVNTTYMFTRSSLPRPVVQLPGPPKATVAVSCCPVLFELRKSQDPDEGTSQETAGQEQEEAMDTSEPAEKSDASKDDVTKDASNTDDSTKSTEQKNAKVSSLFDLPYRMVFAVATEDSVVLYDTQQNIPFAMVSNIHYHQLSDLSWSSDGKILVVASTDGYCTLINFEDEELGVPYKDPSKTVVVDTKDNVTVTQVKGDSLNQRSSEVGSNNVVETKKSPAMVVKTTSPPPSNMSKNKGTQPRRIQITTLTSSPPTNKTVAVKGDSSEVISIVKNVDSNLTNDGPEVLKSLPEKTVSPSSNKGSSSQPRRIQVTTLTSAAPSTSAVPSTSQSNKPTATAAPRRVGLTTICTPQTSK